MKVYVTVTSLLSVEEFEIETQVDPNLPWHEYIEALNLHKILDHKYPDWQGYDLDIDEEDIKIDPMFEKLELSPIEEDIEE